MAVVKISEFTKTVLEIIQSIPKGQVASYKQVAELAGKPQASRGVSWILHSCSTKYKLPWHRVLNSQGKISFDPRSSHFVQQKRLLGKEGVEVSADGSLDLKKYQWKKKRGKISTQDQSKEASKTASKAASKRSSKAVSKKLRPKIFSS